MISLHLVGDTALITQFERFPNNLRVILRRRMWDLALRLQHRVQTKLSGQVLRVVTGALRRSIQADVRDEGATIVGRVFSSGDVKYARIHEFGGRTRAHIIEPRKAAALAFMMNGHMVFAKSVNHPGSVMPERSFLRSSMEDMRNEILRSMFDALSEAGPPR